MLVVATVGIGLTVTLADAVDKQPVPPSVAVTVYITVAALNPVFVGLFVVVGFGVPTVEVPLLQLQPKLPELSPLT